jgi:hypothetical protein
MIVVLDTNVIISSLLSTKGAPAAIIRRWEAQQFEVVTSLPLITELERAITYPHVQKYLKFSAEEVETFLTQWKTVTTVVDPQITLQVIDKDPADNRVLECAVAGEANFIVSGNRHLLEVAEYQGVVILNPTGFLAVLQAESKGE